MTAMDTIQRRLDMLFPGVLGIRLIEATRERVVGRLTVLPRLCTAGDVLHGGALMAFADTLGAVGTVANLPTGKRTTTTGSGTAFLASAPSGATVLGECVALHRGRTTMVWQTTMRCLDTGKECAVVTQTQLILDGESKT